MTLQASVAAQAASAIESYGQVAVIRRRNETFDESTRSWVQDSAPTDTAVNFVPEQVSDVRQAAPALEGDGWILVPGSHLAFMPFVGSSSRRHLEVYFGDWTTLSEATVASATSSGLVVEVQGRELKFRDQQILWKLMVATGDG